MFYFQVTGRILLWVGFENLFEKSLVILNTINATAQHRQTTSASGNFPSAWHRSAWSKHRPAGRMRPANDFCMPYITKSYIHCISHTALASHTSSKCKPIHN